MKTHVDGYILQVSPYKERQAALLVLTETGKQTFFVTNSQSSKSASFAATSAGAFSRFFFQEKKGVLKHSETNLLKHPMQTLEGVHRLLAYELLIELTIKYVQEEDSHRYYTPFKNAVETLTLQPLVGLN